MAKISTLPTVTSLGGTDKLVAVASGVTSAIEFSDLANDSPLANLYQAFVERGHPLASGGTRVGVPGAVFNNTGTFTVVANTIYYAGFEVRDGITVDACLCEVTANAGTDVRIGIMNADTAWQPSAVKKDAGTVGSASNGVKTASFTDIQLAAGRYLTALVCDGAATFRMVNGTTGIGELNPSIGSNTLIVRHSLAAVGTGALSAANDWDTATAGTASQQHMVFLRVTGI